MQSTKAKIDSAAKQAFALYGYDGLRMRQLAQQAGVSLSVTYHYYQDKDSLLERLFAETVKLLGQKRQQLPQRSRAATMLKDRIGFQLDHAVDIVFILKYYLHYRDRYQANPTGYLPETAYTHIKEVLRHGEAQNEWHLQQPIEQEAKVITHAINGFVLEYFPAPLAKTEKAALITSIHDFIVRALQSGSVARQGSKTLS